MNSEYYAAGLLDESVALFKGQPTNDPIKLEGHSLGIVDVAFNNNKLAVSSLDSVLRIWDLEKSVKIKEIQCEQSILIYNLVDNWKICWFKDYLCTAGEGGRVSIFDDESPIFSVENSFASCITSNNQSIAIGTDSGSLHIIEDPLSKRKLHQKKSHKRMIRSVKFSNDGIKAYTASDDGEIKLTDLMKMKEIKSFGKGLPVNSLDVCPTDDKLIVSCCQDYTIRLWDTLSGQCIEQFSPFDKRDDKIWQVKFSVDGSMIGICSQQGQFSLYKRN